MVGNRVVGAASVEVVRAVDVEIEPLVELVRAEIAAKLQAVIPDHFSIAVRHLVGVSLLREFSFKVIANGKTAGNVDIGNAFPARSKIRVNSQVWVRGIRKTVSGSDCLAGILHQRGVLGMQESSLALTEKRKSQLI